MDNSSRCISDIHHEALMLDRIVKGDDGVLTFFWSGELVGDNRSELKEPFIKRIPDGKSFVIDFTKCGHIDNKGVAALVSMSAKTRKAQKNPLKLSGLNPELKEQLLPCHLDAIFKIT